MSIEFPYVYAWGPRWKGIPGDVMGNRKGQRCRVLVRGGKNSVLIEFPDGFWVFASRYALRKAR